MVVEVARRFFFFQAEDGIRDKLVTGVQTCALPILLQATRSAEGRADHDWASADPTGFRLDSSRTGSHKLGVLAGWHGAHCAVVGLLRHDIRVRDRLSSQTRTSMWCWTRSCSAATSFCVWDRLLEGCIRLHRSTAYKVTGGECGANFPMRRRREDLTRAQEGAEEGMRIRAAYAGRARSIPNTRY